MNESIRGCGFTNLWVNPKNWKEAKSIKELRKQWYIQYKFYDPVFHDKYPEGFPVRIKLNRYKTLKSRKAAIKLLLVEIPHALQERHWNPITRTYMRKLNETKAERLGNTWFAEALEQIRVDLQSITDKTKKDIRSTINCITKIGKHTHPNLMIKDMHSGHIRDILDSSDCTNNRYNKHLSYLSILWNELVEKRVVNHNPVRDIRRRKITRKIRKVMDIDQLNTILQILKRDHYNFYRFTVIFFYSGGRIAEFMRLQAKDVNLDDQEYKVIIKKGREYAETMKVILPAALPLWKEVMSEVKSKDDYVFSRSLEPGPDMVRSYQVTKRWRRLVKLRYDVEADYYSMKHLFLDMLDAQMNNPENNFSSKMASHRSTAITNSVYLINKQKREREMLKKIDIKI